MLQKLPRALGRALRNLRPGMGRLVYRMPALAEVPEAIAVSSPAFAPDGPIPPRYTADGAGVSPPLAWRGVPAAARAVALIVEDADSPAPTPFVHCLAWDLRSGESGELADAALASPGAAGGGHALGRNAVFRAQYLPPDPPPGHGPHRYAFQVFALRARLELRGTPGRKAVVDGLRRYALARGLLVGTYERR